LSACQGTGRLKNSPPIRRNQVPVADFYGILVAMLDLAAGDRFHGTKPAYDVKLSVEELHRIALWLDCLSVLYGVYKKEGGEAQLRGEIARPALES
jgi:hypothetical protein